MKGIFYEEADVKSKILAVSFVLFALAALTLGAEEAEPKKATLPVLLNILPGLGLGSFIQGDPLGGLVGLGGEVAGIGMAGYGLVFGYANLLGAIFTGMVGGDTSDSAKGMELAVYVGIGGLVVWVGTKVFEIARPIVYARRFNQEHSLAALAFAPTLVADEKGLIEPGLVLQLSF